MSIIDQVKELVSTVQKIDNVELNRQIPDLQAEVLDLAAENGELKRELAELKKQLATNESLVYHAECFWLPNAEGGFEGPFLRPLLGHQEPARSHAHGRVH